MKDLNDKVVLITGAARGMGRLHAINFGKEGARLVVTDIDEKLLKETADELKAKGYRVDYYKHDVSSRDDCFRLAEKVKDDAGTVDVLVNNAGITRSAGVLDYSEEEYRRITDVDYLGIVWMMQAFVPGMVEQSSGHVVNICSIAGKFGVPMLSPYCGAKAASVVVTDSIRLELKNSGVNFTMVDPYFAKTGMFDGARTIPIMGWQSAEKISAKLVDAVKKNRGEVCVPPFRVRLFAVSRALGFIKFFDLIFRVLGAHHSVAKWKEDKSRPF
ncbi:MAG: SDR family NAD(P)-dependent oxidoreductase [Actinobacteria bacterium]|nr:SDR family NAD(P)-dependent oxidoreductase [Actinomycetota bacterium]